MSSLSLHFLTLASFTLHGVFGCCGHLALGTGHVCSAGLSAPVCSQSVEDEGHLHGSQDDHDHGNQQLDGRESFAELLLECQTQTPQGSVPCEHPCGCGAYRCAFIAPTSTKVEANSQLPCVGTLIVCQLARMHAAADLSLRRLRTQLPYEAVSAKSRSAVLQSWQI